MNSVTDSILQFLHRKASTRFPAGFSWLDQGPVFKYINYDIDNKKAKKKGENPTYTIYSA